jgi:Ca2+-binding EF-hand superfamily protein
LRKHFDKSSKYIQVDKDGDGEIDFDEFVQMITSTMQEKVTAGLDAGFRKRAD